jgi:hypothetical protein
MNPKTTTAAEETEPMLALQARVLYRNRDGRSRDVTHQNLFSLAVSSSKCNG